jgi:hypothetical protein
MREVMERLKERMADKSKENELKDVTLKGKEGEKEQNKKTSMCPRLAKSTTRW